jgi:ubiquinone/menaquinone biosynthesis C-methylase UbiE
MSSYWDRWSKTYTQIGDTDFWLKHRLRLLEGLDGRALEVCCGGGRLILEMLKRDIDAYGIDLSPKMIEQTKTKLADAGFDPGRVSIADVTRLPFGDGDFDVVLSTGAMALFRPALQRAAIGEMARVARREVRLLESFEKRKGFYVGRALAFVFDGMRPIPRQVFADCGLDCREEMDIFGGAFSYLRCARILRRGDML